VHRGFTSGANEFFYVKDVTDKVDFFQIKPKIKNMGEFSNIKEIKEVGLRIAYNKKGDTYWLLEEEFLKPVIKSPRECKSIIVKMENLKYKVFMCNKSKGELKRTKAIEYITWGEKQKYHKRPTCASRRYWWNLGERIISDLLYPYMIGEIHKVFLNSKVLADNNLFDIKVKKNDRDIMYKMIFYLNSTLYRLFLELNGREMTGSLTVLKIQIYELKNIFVILPEIGLAKIKNVIYKLSKRKINSLTIELGFNPTKPIREQ